MPLLVYGWWLEDLMESRYSRFNALRSHRSDAVFIEGYLYERFLVEAYTTKEILESDILLILTSPSRVDFWIIGVSPSYSPLILGSANGVLDYKEANMKEHKSIAKSSMSPNKYSFDAIGMWTNSTVLNMWYFIDENYLVMFVKAIPYDFKHVTMPRLLPALLL